MQVHYSTRFTLYCADAIDVLPLLKPKNVGLIAGDPPYGKKWQSGRRTKAFDAIANDDGAFDAIGLIGAYVRTVLMPHRHVYVFGNPYETIREALALGGGCDLVWDKGIAGSGDLTSVWGPQHETIGFGVYVPSKANREKGNGNLVARMRRGSVLRVQRPNGVGVTKHPTEKPVVLMRQIVESSTVIDDIVLDMFAGSGSTLVAAILSGRKAIGIELDPAYYALTLERCIRAEALWKQIEQV